MCPLNSQCHNIYGPHAYKTSYYFVRHLCLRETVIRPVSGNVSDLLVDIRASVVNTEFITNIKIFDLRFPAKRNNSVFFP